MLRGFIVLCLIATVSDALKISLYGGSSAENLLRSAPTTPLKATEESKEVASEKVADNAGEDKVNDDEDNDYDKRDAHGAVAGNSAVDAGVNAHGAVASNSAVDAEVEAAKTLSETSAKIASATQELASTKRQIDSMETARNTDTKELAKLNERLQKKITDTAANLIDIKVADMQFAQLLDKVEEKFLAEYSNSIIDPRDMPRAILTAEQLKIEEHRKQGGHRPSECPYTCDPTFCSNSSAEDTQCFKVNFDENKENQKVCEKFTDFDSMTCPEGYSRCAMVVPERDATFKLFTSNATHPYDQPMEILGHNLNRCLRLSIIPQEDSCDDKDITKSLYDSVKIMGMSGSPSHPDIHTRQDGKQVASFNKIEIFKEGTFKACLLQFHEDYRKGKKLLIIGTSEVGTVNAIKDDDAVAKALKIREDAQMAKEVSKKGTEAQTIPTVAKEASKKGTEAQTIPTVAKEVSKKGTEAQTIPTVVAV